MFSMFEKLWINANLNDSSSYIKWYSKLIVIVGKMASVKESQFETLILKI